MALNPIPRMSRYLAESGALRTHPFSLIDVGASGGIAPHWRVFGESLQSVGFDPLVSEIERLNAAESNPAVKYVAAMVGYHDIASLIPNEAFSTDPYTRTSSVRAQQRLSMNYTATYFDQTHQASVTPETIELDEYLASHPVDADFVKVDTDTADMAPLLGARRLLGSVGPVALALETSLVGCAFPHANMLPNLSNYLQEFGYSLFALESRTYSRAALPRVFRWAKPAETFGGQAVWADTLFCRDVCIPGYEAQFQVSLTPHKLLKLCCAFEIFSLEDCAAEILITYRDRLEAVIDVERCLNLLTPPLPDGRQVTHQEYLDEFDHHVESFYPGGSTPDYRQLQAQLEECESEVAKLRHAMETSVALRLARSVPWIARPLRSLFMKND